MGLSRALRPRPRAAALLLVCSLLGGGCAGPLWWTGPPGEPAQLVLGSRDQGCTAVPDLAGGHPCLIHDFAYSVGGTEQDRFTADAELLAGLALYGVPEPIAFLYYVGVRWLGWIKWDYTDTRTRRPRGP